MTNDWLWKKQLIRKLTLSFSSDSEFHKTESLNINLNLRWQKNTNSSAASVSGCDSFDVGRLRFELKLLKVHFNFDPKPTKEPMLVKSAMLLFVILSKLQICWGPLRTSCWNSAKCGWIHLVRSPTRLITHWVQTCRRITTPSCLRCVCSLRPGNTRPLQPHTHTDTHTDTHTHTCSDRPSFPALNTAQTQSEFVTTAVTLSFFPGCGNVPRRDQQAGSECFQRKRVNQQQSGKMNSHHFIWWWTKRIQFPVFHVMPKLCSAWAVFPYSSLRLF